MAAGPRGFFSDPHVRAAVREMEALGLHVSERARPGCEPCGVLAGRANARWFLMPLRPRAVCASSLALIQPLRFTPRLFKRLASASIRFGLSGLWLRGRAYVSGINRIAAVFGSGAVHAAFMTGTAGPHRKLVMQCMDGDGSVRGYAKVSRTPDVHALLANEAATLRALHALDLQSALIPRVLLHEVRDGTAVLATDAIGTPPRVPRAFLPDALHRAFLDELAQRTAPTWSRDGDPLLQTWHAQVQGVAGRLSDGWRERFRRVLHVLSQQPGAIASRGLAHGDFTPVNTFRHRDRLYVFDWEYAGGDYPADFDLIRYLVAVMRLESPQPAQLATAVLDALTREFDREEREARLRLIAYACVYALRGACRQPAFPGTALKWTGGRDDALLLDALLAESRRGHAAGGASP